MRYYTAILLSTICLVLLAHKATQAQVTTQRLAWNHVDVAAKVAQKASVSLFVNERYYMAPAAQHQFVVRINAQYALKHRWSVFSGYTYFLQSPHEPEATYQLAVPEHRLQQGFNHQLDYGRVALLQRYQVEQRFLHNTFNNQLAAGYRFVFRARYRMFIDIKLWDWDGTKPKGDLVLRMGHEIHLSAGKSIKGQVFDQNRATAVLQYFITDNLMLEAGYLHWYQQRNAQQGFFNRHIFTTGLQVKLDFSRKRQTSITEPKP